MALQKVPQNINFAKGVDTKTDSWQVLPENFLELVNSVFDTGGQLKKRNGYLQLPILPLPANSLSTFKDNLLAIEDNIQVLTSSGSWIDKGILPQVQLSAVPIVRTATGQTAQDVAVKDGTACAVWLDTDGNTYYQVVDAITGHIILGRTQLPSGCTFPRVFANGTWFIITFLIGNAPARIEYIAVPINNPTAPIGPTSLSAQVKDITAGYDGVVANGNVYLAWNASDLGGAIRSTWITQALGQGFVAAQAGQTADLMSLAADTSGSTPVIYMTYWDSSSTNGHTMSYNQNLVQILAPTLLFSTTVITKITSVADQNLMTAFYQVANTYPSTVRSDFIRKNTCTSIGTVGTPSIVIRSVGLGSKSFILNNNIYMLASWQSVFQPSYFLMKSDGDIIARLAYPNGSGYGVNQVLPSVTVNATLATVGYLFADLIEPVNKTLNSPPSGVYSQTGINLANFIIADTQINTAEIGGALHITGGLLWMYDGAKAVEHGFNVYPEAFTATPSASTGTMTAQTYFYQVTYEWTDASGNIHRSAPSVPFQVTLTGGENTVTLVIPTLRITYKIEPNKVRIGIYRWSTDQQLFYQITSYTAMPINDTTIDTITVVDGAPSSAILGNALVYTTGGVLENIPMPATKSLSIFKSRLFAIDGEDQNLLWYSKVTLENTPVEMTDLQTLYIAPTISSEGSTGVNECIFPLDDKLILFKTNAIYYLTGNGPDATGSQNDYGDPVFITSTVGCTNPNSIVFMPDGLMFQSDKGIWLVGRDLSTKYIGAPVEIFNSATVLSAFTVPETNQVRFTLDNGITLMYDYFYDQWGWFEGIPGISSTIYQKKHTYVNQFNQVFQENPGSYLDGGKPVLMRFLTSWFKMAGLQGLQRLYYFYLLGQYYSPHKLNVTVAYDYNSSPTQSTLVSPINFNGTYGDDPLYGNGSPYGGNERVEQWRVFLDRQKCQSFQIGVSEQFDTTLNAPAGAGLTLSGVLLVTGIKKGWNTLNPNLSTG